MNWECQLAGGEQDKEWLSDIRMAYSLCRQNKDGEALEILLNALKEVRRSGSKKREAFILIHIGKVYQKWITDIALKFYLEGLFVARSCEFKRAEMIAFNAIGELYYAEGKQNEAMNYYRKSLNAACDLEDPSCRRDILLDMIDCYEARGEIDRCEELLQEAIRLDEDMGTPSLENDPDRANFVNNPR